MAVSTRLPPPWLFHHGHPADSNPARSHCLPCGDSVEKSHQHTGKAYSYVCLQPSDPHYSHHDRQGKCVPFDIHRYRCEWKDAKRNIHLVLVLLRVQRW